LHTTGAFFVSRLVEHIDRV